VTAGRVDEIAALTGQVTWKDGALLVGELHLGVAGGRVSFQGDIDPDAPDGIQVLTNGYAVPLERIGSWFGVTHPLLTGELAFRVLTTGSPDTLLVTGDVRGTLADGTDREFRLAAARRGNVLSVESLDIATGESRVELEGHVTLSDPPQVHGVAVLRNLDPALLAAEPDLARVRALEGTVRFDGTGTSRETFEGSLSLDLEGGEFFGLDVDAASLEAILTRGRVDFPDVQLRRGQSWVTGSGTIDAANQVRAHLTGTVHDLGDLAPVTGESFQDALRGQATARFDVSGPLAGPAVEGTLHFGEARVLGARAASLDLDLRSDAIGVGGALDVAFEGRGVGYGDRVIPLLTGTGTWIGGAVTVTELRLEGARRGELRLQGELDVQRTGDVSGSITRLEVSAPDGGPRWANEAPIAIVRDPDQLSFRGLDLRHGAGRITGDVSVRRTGTTAVQAQGVDVDLAVFSPFLLLPQELSGTLDFTADAVVGPDTLDVDLDLDLGGGGYGGETLERVTGRFRVTDEGLDLRNVALRTSIATVDAEGRLGLQDGTLRTVLADSTRRSRLTDEVRFEDLRVLFETSDADSVKKQFGWFPSPGGGLTFEARLNGTAAHPVGDFGLTITDGRIRQAKLDRVKASATLDGTRLTVRAGRLDSGDGSLVAQGELPVLWNPFDPKPHLQPGGPVDLRFRAQALPVEALTILATLFEMGEGPVYSEGRLTGTVGDLWLEGTFFAEGGRLAIPEFADPLIDGAVQGRYDREGVHLDEIRFGDGQGGAIEGSGVIRLPNLKFAGMDLTLTGRNYRYRSQRGVEAIGDGHVEVKEALRSDGKLIAHFTGGFDVERALIDERIFLLAETAAENAPEMPEGVRIPEEARQAPGAERTELEETPPTPVLVDLDLSADKNVWIRTEEMELEIAGAVTFHIAEEYIGLSGQAHTLRGRYAVLNSDFDVDRGEMQFVDPSDIFASVMDAEASTRVLDENVTFDVAGTLGDPIVVGRTESGMSEAEIYELLTLRQKRATDDVDPGTTGVVSGAFYESWGALLATRFGRELGREIGLDTFDVAVEGDGARDVRVGKYLGSDVFVRYRERIGSTDATTTADEARALETLETPERQLLLEYRLSRILQLQGETGVIQEDPYLNVDLKAEWGY
jgi:autotransporter translocation and assembly factor TamB